MPNAAKYFGMPKELHSESPIAWLPMRGMPSEKGCQKIVIAGLLIGWIEPRNHYCDRGHWKINIDLPGIDSQDGFPRYFMSREVAVAETEAFLRWRLWGQRTVDKASPKSQPSDGCQGKSAS